MGLTLSVGRFLLPWEHFQAPHMEKDLGRAQRTPEERKLRENKGRPRIRVADFWLPKNGKLQREREFQMCKGSYWSTQLRAEVGKLPESGERTA